MPYLCIAMTSAQANAYETTMDNIATANKNMQMAFQQIKDLYAHNLSLYLSETAGNFVGNCSIWNNININ